VIKTISTVPRDERYYDVTIPEEQAKRLRVLFEFIQPTDLQEALKRARIGINDQQTLVAFKELKDSILAAVPLG
jgi:hypothetical protein